LLDVDHEDVFAYTRTFEGKTVIVVTNFRKTLVKWSLPEKITLQQDMVLVSNYDGVSVADGAASLRPFEAFAAFVN
jgi:hypothetical protein